MDENQKQLSDISRDEWAIWEWINITTPADDQPIYVRGEKRTPDKVKLYAAYWDAWREAAND